MSKVIPLKTVIETKLYQELLTRNNITTKPFVANIPTICEEASDRIKILPHFFLQYTLHDQSHFLRVTEIMSMILGDTVQQLNDIEIGLLILTAFFHDQGMVIESTELEDLENNDQYVIFKENWFIDHPNYFETTRQSEDNTISQDEQDRIFKVVEELESAMLTDFLRINHGQRSYDYICQTYAKDKRLEVNGINLTVILACICLSHTQSAEWINAKNGLNLDENIGIYKVNTAFIALILRLADILDFDADRTPDVLFKSIHFTSSVSIKEWQKHRSVQGWEISNNLIRFSMAFEHPVYEKSARSFMDWIDYELTEVHKIVRNFPKSIVNYTLNIPEKTNRERMLPKGNAYIYNDVEFSLSRDEVVKLLMTNNLYKKPSLFVRELLQNSLDALRLRKANYKKEGLEWTAGKIYFRHYIDDSGQHIIECSDNGCGMDIDVISKFFGKVGRSYYRSPEFERQRLQLKEKGVDFEPCSQFGIGFMSCFMVGDRIEILTRKDYGIGKDLGKPLFVEINGLGGLMVIREGKSDQNVGTTVKVFNREKPIIYDKYSDHIHLLLTLNGYALGNEFPIEADCDIDSIKGSVIIPAVLDKKYTFLEENQIKSIKTIEIDLTTINKNLYGFLRQSFLVDKDGKLCLENNEAKWELIIDDNWKGDDRFKMAIFNKANNKHRGFEYHVRDDHSVCLDGILVCGTPGRNFHNRYDMMDLGWISPKIHSEHPFTIDARGDIKPEINPAREPAENESMFSMGLGWRRIQRFLDLGSGNLWEKVLAERSNGLTITLFWQLLLIYDGCPLNIFSTSIIKYLALPSQNKKWINISDINIIRITEDKIVAETNDKNNYEIEFDDEIKNLGKAHMNPVNWKYWIQNLLIGISQLQLIDDELVLKTRKEFESVERPKNVILRSCRCLNYVGLGKEYILTSKYDEIVNLKNPIVELGYNAYLSEKKDNLQQFATSLIVVIPRLIKQMKEDKQELTLKVNWRSLKFLGAEYMLINWNKYDVKFRPPYKIYIDKTNFLEITDEILKNWSRQKIHINEDED